MENKGPQVFNVAVTFLVLTWITVGLRVYCRTAVIPSLGIDDKLMVFLLVCVSCELLALLWPILHIIDNAHFIYTGYLISQIVGVAYGIGQIDDDITSENKRVAFKVHPHRCTSPFPSNARPLLTASMTALVYKRDPQYLVDVPPKNIRRFLPVACGYECYPHPVPSHPHGRDRPVRRRLLIYGYISMRPC